jgi:hypothetical protein
VSSSNLLRWSGAAAMVGGALIVVKGFVIALSDDDPSLVPPATLLFAAGLVGLHARLEGSGGLLGRIGVGLAYLAVAASIVNLVYLGLGVAPEDPNSPALVKITYMAAFLGILVGLLLLGFATLRARVMPARLRAVPLAVGLLWFPLMGITWFLGEGLVVAGLAWALVGYVVWSGAGGPVRRRARQARR